MGWAGNEAGGKRGLGMKLGKTWAGNEAGGRCGLGMRLGGDVGWE